MIISFKLNLREVDGQECGVSVYRDFNQRHLKKSFSRTEREVDGQETVGVLPWA